MTELWAFHQTKNYKVRTLRTIHTLCSMFNFLRLSWLTYKGRTIAYVPLSILNMLNVHWTNFHYETYMKYIIVNLIVKILMQMRKTFTFQMPVSVSESCRRVLQPVSHSLTLVSAFFGDAIEAQTFQQRRIIFDWKNVQQFTSFEQIQMFFWRKYFFETCRLITFSKVEKY